MNNIDKYREFCQKEEDIPVFCKDWWLDAVCQNSWDVSLVEKGSQIMASLPYFKSKNNKRNVIKMPLLTQFMGPFIKYPPDQKYYKKLSWEKEIIFRLMSLLPSVASFSQNLNYRVTNWLPFFWLGYQQTTRYTYVIESIDINKIESNLASNIRRRYKKSVKESLKVYESDDVKLFYEINKKTYKRKKITISYDFNFVNRLYKSCIENNACKIFFAEDVTGEVIAASFLVYDLKTVYYLMGGIVEDKKNLGGMEAILIEGIKFAMNTNRTFDFEGSMVESIEKYFRSFGAIQRPYFNIYKTQSNFLKTIDYLKSILK